MIEKDQRCARCGYNLRSLTLAGHCPECGLGVERTLALNGELGNSRPDWVAGLAWGSLLVLGAHILVVLAIPAAVVLEAAGGFTMLGLAVATYVAGFWLLTRAENPHGPRRFSIWNLMVFLPCPLFQIMTMRRLAMRMPNPQLAEHVTIIGIGHPLTVAGLGLWRVLMPYALPLSEEGFYIVATLLIAFVFFYLWSMNLYASFAIGFRRVAAAARESWMAADAALRSAGTDAR